MKTIFSYIFCILQFVSCGLYSQNKVKLGAYYFDGWRSTRSVHLTSALVTKFSSREPKWGWVTSSQAVVDEQIEVAANNGLDFFSFCWFYKKEGDHPLNSALNFYLKSRNKDQLEFGLLISNHTGYEIGPENWVDFQRRMIKYFKQPTYIMVNSKPLITFFSLQSLIKKFGSTRNVADAFRKFRLEAARQGLDGVTIASCVSNDVKSVRLAEECGFDILTGYNYHDVGLFRQSGNVPIERMIDTERKIWNSFKTLTKLKYMPVSTLNWDPRPWANKGNNYGNMPYYTGFSKKSVVKSVQGCAEWLLKNGKYTTAERLGILYAWNEYGEGAYLTPTKHGESFSQGITEALKNANVQ
jgi:hypothetical protein